MIGNLEGTLATGGYVEVRPVEHRLLRLPRPAVVRATARQAGFTLMNVANNHAYDYGSEGQRETLAALRSNGLRYTGQPGQITVVRAAGVRIAVIGFAPYPWAQSLTDIAAARRIVQRAKKQADLVVVLMHAGAEGSDQQHVGVGTDWFLGENRGNPKAFSHAVVDAGADLVLGSGPHVLRGMEWYHGRLIAYSLGNFLGDGTLGIGGVLGASGILHATLAANGGWVRGDLTPVRLVSPGLPALDPAEEAHGIVRTLSRAGLRPERDARHDDGQAPSARLAYRLSRVSRAAGRTRPRRSGRPRARAPRSSPSRTGAAATAARRPSSSDSITGAWTSPCVEATAVPSVPAALENGKRILERPLPRRAPSAAARAGGRPRRAARASARIGRPGSTRARRAHAARARTRAPSPDCARPA